MILDLVIHPNKTLRTLCSEVETVNKKIKKLCKDMVSTMNNHDGLGLAAPQIGQTVRIIAFKNQETFSDTIMINPKIISYTKNMGILQEGCLSIPGTLVNVIRPEEIVVEFTTVKGNQQRKKFGGMNSRIIQHEIDHLDGRLIIDYLQKNFNQFASNI